MKKLTGLLLALFLAQTVMADVYVPTTATFVVRDDEGHPVTNALIEGGFRDHSIEGSKDRFKATSDTNGMLVAKGKAVLSVGGRITAEGYYQTMANAPMNRQRGRRIEHWNVEIPVTLKRIRNPIPMYAKEVRNPHLGPWEDIGKYLLARTSSYDMLMADFCPPYGSGQTADIEFIWNMTIHSTHDSGRAKDFDTTCEVRMTNTVDGICKGTPDGSDDGRFGSRYIAAYEAPADGYTPVWQFVERVRWDKVESNDDRHYLYYFRIRTQTNEFGQTTNALYGKIYGQLNGNFTYYINPTPNDRNMEFDPDRNLFTTSTDRYRP